MVVDVLNELFDITEEEKAILQLKKEVSKDIYTSQESFVIESEKFLSNNKMIMIRKHTRFVDFPKHKHNYIEINYVYNGKLNQKVGNDHITLNKGELLFLNQHIEHEIEACGKDDIIINFIIQPQFFEFIFSYLTSENMMTEFLISSLYDNTHNGQYLYFAVSEVTSIQELLKKIIIEIMNPSILSESTIKFYMGLFVIELIKHADKISQKGQYSQERLHVVEVMKYIDEHYRDGSLQKLALKLNQPHYALSKQIKRMTSYTFKELLQEKRLEKAKELLESTTIPITDIIDQVGYDNISYFYRIFKSKYNKTPKQFREQLVR